MGATESENILLSYEEAAAAERSTVKAITNRVYRKKLRVERNGGYPRIPISELSPTAQARAREIIRQREATAAAS